jgi:hypothetical protein
MRAVHLFGSVFFGMAAWARILVRRRQANGGARSDIHEMAFQSANGAWNPGRALENEGDGKKARRPTRLDAHLIMNFSAWVEWLSIFSPQHSHGRFDEDGSVTP